MTSEAKTIVDLEVSSGVSSKADLEFTSQCRSANECYQWGRFGLLTFDDYKSWVLEQAVGGRK